MLPAGTRDTQSATEQPSHPRTDTPAQTLPVPQEQQHLYIRCAPAAEASLVYIATCAPTNAPGSPNILARTVSDILPGNEIKAYGDVNSNQFALVQCACQQTPCEFRLPNNWQNAPIVAALNPAQIQLTEA